MNDLSQISDEKIKIIKNIESALLDGDTFRKVSVNDPEPNDEDIKRVILPFDNKRNGCVSRIKAFIARKLAESFTKKVNTQTEIVGLENALGIRGSAIITSNHYNPTDSTPIRMLAKLLDKEKKLHISVQESNVFMTGMFGFLMKNCNTHPFSRNAEYMVKNLKPALEEILKNDSLLLIYPEQEMWYNYKKPRPLRDGAYHYASLFKIPVIPTFTEMVTLKGEKDSDGFLPIKHILHVLPPIYPNSSLSVRENRTRMQTIDYILKKKCYEDVYKTKLDYTFNLEKDIAGLVADEI